MLLGGPAVLAALRSWRLVRTGIAIAAVVAALCLVTVGADLALLGPASDSLPAMAVSACIFGVGYMMGSAALAVWTAEPVPALAGAASTGCLVVGAFSSVAAPALAGAVIPGLGLGRLLVLTAAVSLLGGMALMPYRSLRGRTA